MPDDDDEVDELDEFDMWKLRELKRVRREREERASMGADAAATVELSEAVDDPVAADEARKPAEALRVRVIRPRRVLTIVLVVSALGPTEAPKPRDGGSIPLAGTAGTARTASEREVPGERRRTAEHTTGDRPGDASERHGDLRRVIEPTLGAT